MIALLLVGLLGTLGTPLDTVMTQYDRLPASWQADGGIPVALNDGSTLFMYGDTFTDGASAHNSVVVDGQALLNVLPDTASGTWFWPSDAVQHPDGRLVVVVNEIERDMSSWFGFRTVDTDVFVVREPRSVMSWRLAEHVDEGWWDGYNVAFLDQDPSIALVRHYGDDCTYDVDTTAWDPQRGDLVFCGSDGVAQPVEHAGHYWVVAWDMGGHTYTISRFADGDWELMATEHWPESEVRYGHRLNIIDGRVVLNWSNGTGAMRPEYHDVTSLIEEL